MARFSSIDLSRIDPPAVVEELSFDAVVQSMKDAALALLPSLARVIDLESEPVHILIQAFAYRELLMRQRLNDAAKAVMLATAVGSDLENLAAILGVARLVITPADPEAEPPVLEVLESDADLRRRAQLALEGFSTAGPAGAYLFHTLSADADVLDAGVTSPEPGEVDIVVLARNGVPSSGLLEKVRKAVNGDEVRPLCDDVTVRAATLVNYAVEAEIVVFDGPDASTVLTQAQAALDIYVSESARLGRAVRISGIHAALHQPGVERVDLAEPEEDIEPDADEAAWCTGTTVTVSS